MLFNRSVSNPSKALQVALVTTKTGRGLSISDQCGKFMSRYAIPAECLLLLPPNLFVISMIVSSAADQMFKKYPFDEQFDLV